MTSLVVTALCTPPSSASALATELGRALASVGYPGLAPAPSGQVVRLTLEAAPPSRPDGAPHGAPGRGAAKPDTGRISNEEIAHQAKRSGSAQVRSGGRAQAVELRRALAAELATAGVAADLAVRPAELCRPPRLLVLDMDSTLITIEVIDELARRHGVGAEVAAVTERAMRGELDFEASLRARVAKLRGLPIAALDAVAAGLELSPGAEQLIGELKARGAKVAIASGGFTFAAQLLQRRLGLHAAHANVLEVVDGALTGQVLGAVVTAERKAEVVRQLAAEGGFSAEEAVAIGDGANDRLMLAAAGFGVAFRAKPALAAAADATIDHGGLERVLALL